MLKNKATTRTRIILADDSPAVLAGIRRLLVPEFEVVGCVSDGLALVAAAKALRPDVVIVDIMMPGISGLEAVRRLRKLPKVSATPIMLTVLNDPALVVEARTAGAMGYVVKSSADRDLVDAIHSAQAGEFYLSPNREKAHPPALKPVKTLQKR